MNLHRRPGRLAASAALLLLLAGCGTERANPSADPTAIESSTPGPSAAAKSRLTTTGLATGPAPRIAYVVKGRLVLPDGGGFALPKDALAIARLGDLTVVEVRAPSDKDEADSYEITVLDASGVVAKTDPSDCQEGGAGDEAGCTALVNAGDGHAYVSTSHGFTDIAGPMIWANGFVDSARGGVIGMVSQSDDGSCNRLWREGRKPEWQTCDWRFLGVSPQSTAIVTGSPYADGFGDGALGFLDVNGQVLHAWTGGGATVVSTPVWEDDQHVLAVVFQDQAWSVVRFGIDGTMEYAVPPQPGADLNNPFVLETT